MNKVISNKTNRTIADSVGLSVQAVCKSRQHNLQQDLSGRHDKLRPWRLRSISDEKVAALVRKALHSKLQDGRRWTIQPPGQGNQTL